MSKKKITVIILLTIILTLLANVFVGRWLSAKISTLAVLNKFKILSPEAPIVINNQQVVRTSDSTDLLQAANSAKSRISTVAIVDSQGNVTTVGSAVNVTSDGIFVTGSPTFAQQGQKYFVALSNGNTAAISSTTLDTATGLVFFRAPASGVTPANLGNSSTLLPGEKILFLSNSLQSFMPHFFASSVTQGETDVQDKVFDADKPSRSFGAQAVSQLVSGQAVVDSSGQIVGIWNGNSVVSATVLSQAISLYLANPQKLGWPNYGFTYSIITKTQSSLSGFPQGALVQTIKSKISTLQAGDIITSVNGTGISETNMLENELQKYKAGDNVNFAIIRNKQQLNISVKVQ